MSDKRQDITSGLLLPAGQAILTGLLFALAAVSCWKLSQSVTAWRLFFATLAVSAFLAWLFTLRKLHAWGDAERGITPPPPAEIIQPTETVRVTLQSQPAPYLALEWLDLPMGIEQLTGVCLELQARNYETSNLGGAGKTLTRAESERFRDYLIAHGLAEWIRPDAHTAGWRLGGAGRALVRRVCDLTKDTDDTHPTPRLEPRNLISVGAMHTHTGTQTREGRWTRTD